jgi:hypothetical protein
MVALFWFLPRSAQSSRRGREEFKMNNLELCQGKYLLSYFLTNNQ